MLLGLAFVAILLLVCAEFTTIIQIRVGDVVQDTIKGHERHGFALLLIGIAASPMAAGAVLGESRAAAAAVLILGVIALGIAVIGDLPDIHDVGSFSARFESAEASGGVGVVFELLGAGGLIVAGAGWLWLGRSRAGSETPALRKRDQPVR